MMAERMVYRPSCGCEVYRIMHSKPNLYRIQYCPKHEAAPDLYEALKLYQEHQIGTGGHYCWKCAEAINKALAKAEEREDDQIPMDTNMASTRKKMRYL